MRLPDFVSRLKHPHPIAGGYIAHCPAHLDGDASLSVSEGDDGRILVHCHAGCTPQDVCESLGLRLADLFDGPDRPQCPVARPKSEGYEAPGFDVLTWWLTVRHVSTPAKLAPWAEQLGLPVETLDDMGAGTVGNMLTFPMFDGTGKPCGVRTRTRSGDKKAVTGSKAGLFLPCVHLDYEPVVCEGPTDAAAAMALGYEPIGRPSCQGCERHVVETCKRFGYLRVTICADADGPGISGARKLAEILHAARIGTRLVIPGGAKDLREWWKAGATHELAECAWAQAEWK